MLGVFSQENQLVGFVKFKKDQRSKALHKANLYAMYIAPEYRKRGLGKALVLEVLKKAQAFKELEQIHLWVLHSNGHSAASFYKSLGFKSQGIVKQDLKYEGQYIDAEYMVLYL